MPLAAALLAPWLAATLHAAPQGWDDFPVFVWRKRYRGGPPPAELLEPFGATNRFRGEDSDWIAERGLSSYTTNAAGRDDLHLDGGPAWDARVQRWIEGRDPTALQREPCLSDPATRARLHVLLARSLAEVEDDRQPALSLGDEVSLTPYGNPLDLCRAPHCEERWRSYAGARGWEPSSPTTDDVRLALAADDDTLVGPWLARRRFHREELEALLAELAAALHGRTWPGLLGISQETAFGGLSVDAAFDCATFLECYAVGASRELLHTRQAQSSRLSHSLTTLFVQDESPARLSWRAWEHWLRGGDGLVLWNDGLLEDRPRHRERLAASVSAIRRTHARFRERPLRQGVALLHDADSVALAWLEDILLDGPTWPQRRHGYQQSAGSRERKVEAWLRLLEDAGSLPGALDIGRLDAEASRRFPVLVLPELAVLDEADLRALEAHLVRGGTLVLDGSTGERDRRGQRRREDVGRRLAAQLGGQVVLAPAGLGGYVERRLQPARTTRLRAFARTLLRSAGALPLELEPGPEMSRVPWLVSLRPIDESLACAPVPRGTELLLAMLPNLPEAGTLEESGPIELDLSPPPGYALERLAPPPGVSALVPGQAALWRLVPDQD